MDTFYEFMMLVEGPGAPPPPPGGDPMGGAGAPPLGGAPPMGGMGGPPMGGGMGGGMGGPPMGGAPGGAPGGAMAMPVHPKDAWQALELALEDMKKKGSKTEPPTNSVQNEKPEAPAQKRHLMSTPGF